MHEVLLCGGYNAAIRVPLRWRERDFRVYRIHPWKPWPFALYRSTLGDRQQLLDWMQGETLPMLLAGDLNASPRCAFVVRLRAVGLATSSEEVLGLAPPTWPMSTEEGRSPSSQAGLMVRQPRHRDDRQFLAAARPSFATCSP